MSADVAAVLAEALAGEGNDVDPWDTEDAKNMLAALTAANYAVVRLPEGVAVEHGARLHQIQGWGECYVIEATP